MSIRLIQSTFPSAGGLAPISYTVVEPEGAPRGVLQICHGMCEYFNRYMDFARFLAGRGFVVCGNDHLGHGQSVSRPAERGYFGQRGGRETLMKDVHQLTVLMRERYGDLPLFLLGHSMGSLIVRGMLPVFGQEYAGVILMGTAGFSRLAATARRMAASVARRRGPLYRSGRLQKMTFGNYNRRVESPLTPFDWLTRDRDVVALYQQDDNCNFIFTAAGFAVLYSLMEAAQRRASFLGCPTTLPLYLTAGAEDPVGDYGRGVEEVARAYRRAGVREVTLTLYPGARHEILNETCRRQVYDDLLAWLEGHLPPNRNKDKTGGA